MAARGTTCPSRGGLRQLPDPRCQQHLTARRLRRSAISCTLSVVGGGPDGLRAARQQQRGTRGCPRTRSGHWSRTPASKHDIYDGSLDAWFPIILRSFGSGTYADGFAAPGIYRCGEAGSPIRALRHAARDALPMARAGRPLGAVRARGEATRPVSSSYSPSSAANSTTRCPTASTGTRHCTSSSSRARARTPFVACSPASARPRQPVLGVLDSFGGSTQYLLIGRLARQNAGEVVITVEPQHFLRNLDPDRADKVFGGPRVAGAGRRAARHRRGSRRRDLIHDLAEHSVGILWCTGEGSLPWLALRLGWLCAPNNERLGTQHVRNKIRRGVEQGILVVMASVGFVVVVVEHLGLLERLFPADLIPKITLLVLSTITVFLLLELERFQSLDNIDARLSELDIGSIAQRLRRDHYAGVVEVHRRFPKTCLPGT